MKNFLSIAIACIQCLFASAQISTPIYIDNFESGAPGWSANSTSGSVWQLDTVNGSGNGNHVWGIGLDTNYLANTEAYLYTPVFNAPITFGLNLCFWQVFNTAIYDDGMRVEYSLDSGNTWYVFGTVGMGINWYNTYFITSSGNLPGWSGSSPVWQQTSMPLSITMSSALLQFRFVFTSNSSGSMNGYMIDIFCIDDTIICDCANPLGVSELSIIKEPFIIYPNPFSYEINITIKTNELAEFVLYDVTGRKTLHQSFTNSTSINTSHLSKGIYIYEVRNKNGVIKKGKVVKD